MGCERSGDGNWVLIVLVIFMAYSLTISLMLGNAYKRNDEQRERIEALEGYIISHADQVDIELVELLKNIDKVEK